MKQKKKTNSRKLFYDTHISYKEYEAWKDKEILEAEECGDEIYSDEEYLMQYCEYCADANEIARNEFIANSKALNDNEVIVAFVDLGFWDGRVNGFKAYGNKISSIFSLVGCDNLILYVEDRNIKGELTHHDGTHYLLFRVANYAVAEIMSERAMIGNLTREYVMAHSKPLTPYTPFSKAK